MAADQLAACCKRQIPFARHHIVDPGKCLEVGKTHVCLAIRPTDDRYDVWLTLLDLPEQSQGGCVLLKRAAATQDSGLQPENVINKLLYELLRISTNLEEFIARIDRGMGA
jgi:hypothetical protein